MHFASGAATFSRRKPRAFPFEFVAAGSAVARERYGAVPWLGEGLVVASDDGEVWVGAAAFLVCLWSLRPYREWSYRLTGPALVPLVERFLAGLSAQRGRIGAFLGPVRCTDGACDEHVLKRVYR